MSRVARLCRIRWLAVVALAGVCGCTQPRYAGQRWQHREQALRVPIASYARREGEAPARLRNDWRGVQAWYERDRVSASELPRDIRSWAERDIIRWNNRGPDFRRGAEEMFGGKPLPPIERTAIQMFY